MFSLLRDATVLGGTGAFVVLPLLKPLYSSLANGPLFLGLQNLQQSQCFGQVHNLQRHGVE